MTTDRTPAEHEKEPPKADDAHGDDNFHDELQIDTTGMLPCPFGCGWKVLTGTPCPEHPNIIVGGIVQ